ncbi:MAG: hypothetical protein ACO1PZ_07680 [Gammaproteobacteria bacterium]
MRRAAITFGNVGLSIGLLCLAILGLIDVFGPDSYSSSGTGMLRADGTLVMTRSSQPLLPLIARSAFYAFVLPLVLGTIAVFRKEGTGPALGSFGLGLAPIPIYALGVLPATAFYAAGLVVTLYATKRGRSGRSELVEKE